MSDLGLWFSPVVQGMLIGFAVYALVCVILLHIAVKYDRRHGHSRDWWPL